MDTVLSASALGRTLDQAISWCAVLLQILHDCKELKELPLLQTLVCSSTHVELLSRSEWLFAGFSSAQKVENYNICYEKKEKDMWQPAKFPWNYSNFYCMRCWIRVFESAWPAELVLGLSLFPWASIRSVWGRSWRKWPLNTAKVSSWREVIFCRRNPYSQQMWMKHRWCKGARALTEIQNKEN